MIADIEPRPAIEGVLSHARHIVGHKIVAEAVALVGGAPGRAALRLDCEADAIADAGGEQLPVLAVGVESKHRRALGLGTPGSPERLLARPSLQTARWIAHVLAGVAGRTDRDQHALVIRREYDVTR